MSALLTSLALASSVAAAISLYLGAPRQQWLTKPWPTRLSIKAGSILMLTAFGLWAWDRTLATAFFSLLTVEMGIFAALPFLALLQKQIPRYSGIGERFLLEFRSRLPSPTSSQQAARKCGEHRWLNWTATYLVTIAVQISTVTGAAHRAADLVRQRVRLFPCRCLAADSRSGVAGARYRAHVRIGTHRDIGLRRPGGVCPEAVLVETHRSSDMKGVAG